MFKLLGGFVIGMFVGAICVEILSRTKPELVDAIGSKAEDTVNMFKDDWSTEEETGGVPC